MEMYGNWNRINSLIEWTCDGWNVWNGLKMF